MTRWLVLAAMALSLGACSSDHDDDDDRPPRYRKPSPDCAANVSCGTCTPVLGCGWCSFADGSGRCASGPSACGETFRWNWEPADCPAVIAPTTDAATPEAATDTGSSEAATDSGSSEVASDSSPEASVCRAPSTFAAGCSRTTGGTLCPSTQYSLGCHSSAKADTALGCTAALTSGTSTYYCCPCGS